MNKDVKDNKTSNTILGRDSEFEGNIKFFGTLLIQGGFKGTISGEGTVSIDTYAVINSDIHASEVNISGTVYGQLSAENKIHVFSSAKIYGDIEAPDIQIEKGSMIKGKCQTHKIDLPNKEERAILN